MLNYSEVDFFCDIVVFLLVHESKNIQIQDLAMCWSLANHGRDKADMSELILHEMYKNVLVYKHV